MPGEQIDQLGGTDFHFGDHAVHAGDEVIVEHQEGNRDGQPGGGGIQSGADTLGQVGGIDLPALVLDLREALNHALDGSEESQERRDIGAGGQG